MINYLFGDATRPRGKGKKIIAHICNSAGGWGAGFVLALSKRWPDPEEAYRALSSRHLGDVQFVPVEPDLLVANMVAQTLSWADGPPIRYDALRTCLEQVARLAADQGASVHMPRIGCGLAGGSWDKVEPILRETLGAAKIPMWVYDYTEVAR